MFVSWFWINSSEVTKNVTITWGNKRILTTSDFDVTIGLLTPTYVYIMYHFFSKEDSNCSQSVQSDLNHPSSYTSQGLSISIGGQFYTTFTSDQLGMDFHCFRECTWTIQKRDRKKLVHARLICYLHYWRVTPLIKQIKACTCMWLVCIFILYANVKAVWSWPLIDTSQTMTSIRRRGGDSYNQTDNLCWEFTCIKKLSVLKCHLQNDI